MGQFSMEILRQTGSVLSGTQHIKPVISEKGILDQIGVSELEFQKLIFQNYFNSLADKYGDRWAEKDNAFLYAAGFTGAMEFLTLKIIPYCNLKESFSAATISDCLLFDHGNLVTQDEVKGLGGKDAPKRVFDRLLEVFHPQENKKKKFEV